ncbi:hypothetical protein L195_g046146 [Trifolium pratense]|uniref:Uncharacterized protein n=1 Tax=Trifolium pratense TaxID=57577 RepID=A0A2K3MGW5_TRIPR|nr:hypothetical protein L195_g046146 [Trifolium pratense]
MHASEEQPDAAAVIFTLLQQIDKAGIFAMIIWSIWNQRNDKVWSNKDTPQQTVVMRAMNFLNDWKNIKNVQTSTSIDMQVEKSVIKCKNHLRGDSNVILMLPSHLTTTALVLEFVYAARQVLLYVQKLNGSNQDVKFMLEKLLVFSLLYDGCMNSIWVLLILN